MAIAKEALEIDSFTKVVFVWLCGLLGTNGALRHRSWCSYIDLAMNLIA